MAAMVELSETGLDPRLYNQDLAPTRIAQRKWTTFNYATLWIGMAHNIPTYLMAGSFIALGMSWWVAVLTVLLGNLIVLIPILLNSHPGTKYGIPFPVLCRASFGVFGANIPAMLRAIVAAGWFGIESFIGGQALNAMIGTVIPGFPHLLGDAGFVGMSVSMWITFLAFWGLNIWIIYHGMEAIRRFEVWAGPLVLLLAIGLLIWAVSAAHGLGPILNQPGKSGAGAVFIPSLVGVIAFWSTLSLNIPDFTRFARSQRDQWVGQTVALPTTMAIFSGFGVLITSASMVVYGSAIWNPVLLVGHFHNGFLEFIGLAAIVLATLSVNVAANVVSPSYDVCNLFPRRLRFEHGGLITGIAAILMVPWKLMSDPHIYVFDWLGIYGGALGPIAAILIADYWVFRRRTLGLKDLYEAQGLYRYTGGFNWNAIVALAVGIFVALIGNVVPALAVLATYSWFVGFIVSFVLYLGLMYSRSGAATLVPNVST